MVKTNIYKRLAKFVITSVTITHTLIASYRRII